MVANFTYLDWLPNQSAFYLLIAGGRLIDSYLWFGLLGFMA